MRLPATDTLENPTPRPAAFQASGGPEGFHSVSSPLSGESASRFGPRQPGQSVGGAAKSPVESARRVKVASGRYNQMDMARLLRGPLKARRPAHSATGRGRGKGERFDAVGRTQRFTAPGVDGPPDPGLNARLEERAPDPGRPRRLRPAPGLLVLAERPPPRLRLRPHRPLLPRGLLGAGRPAHVAAGDLRLARPSGKRRGAKRARAVPPPYVGEDRRGGR